jgi:hypothetical protein
MNFTRQRAVDFLMGLIASSESIDSPGWDGIQYAFAALGVTEKEFNDAWVWLERLNFENPAFRKDLEGALARIYRHANIDPAVWEQIVQARRESEARLGIDSGEADV